MAPAWLAYQRLRAARVERHDACAGCPERGCGGVCSGYAYQAGQLRSYEEAATEWLETRYRPTQ